MTASLIMITLTLSGWQFWCETIWLVTHNHNETHDFILTKKICLARIVYLRARDFHPQLQKGPSGQILNSGWLDWFCYGRMEISRTAWTSEEDEGTLSRTKSTTQHSYPTTWTNQKTCIFAMLAMIHSTYRVTIQLVQNLLLTSKLKFRFGLARPGQARPKRNFCFEVNGRFCTAWLVTL